MRWPSCRFDPWCDSGRAGDGRQQQKERTKLRGCAETVASVWRSRLLGVGHRFGRLLSLPLGQPTPGRKGHREDVPCGWVRPPPHTPMRARGSAAEHLGAEGMLRRATLTKR